MRRAKTTTRGSSALGNMEQFAQALRTLSGCPNFREIGAVFIKETISNPSRQV